MINLSHSTPKARVAHRCAACGVAIDPGVRYARSAYVDSGDFWTWKACLPCDGLVIDVASWAGGLPDEGVTDVDFIEWALELQGQDARADAYLARARARP